MVRGRSVDGRLGLLGYLFTDQIYPSSSFGPIIQLFLLCLFFSLSDVKPTHVIRLPDCDPKLLTSDFGRLDSLSKSRDRRRVFRVWQAATKSPLTWTGEECTSGFAAPNSLVDQLTPGRYAQVFGPLESHNPLGSPWMRQSVVDHIQSRRYPSSDFGGGPPLLHRNMDSTRRVDPKSPWISTTRVLPVSTGRYGGSSEFSLNHPLRPYVLPLYDMVWMRYPLRCLAMQRPSSKISEKIWGRIGMTCDPESYRRKPSLLERRRYSTSAGSSRQTSRRI